MWTPQSCGSIFSGVGGWEIGARQLGVRPAWGVELDPGFAALHEANGAGRVYVGDVQTFDPRNRQFFSRVRVFFASPPCKNVSKARKNRGLQHREDRNIGDVVPVWLDALRPEVFLLENVDGYVEEPVFHRIVAGARKLGYGLQHFIVDAAAVGTPMHRKRVILRAVLGAEKLPTPAPFVTQYTTWDQVTQDLWETLPPSEPLAGWQLEALQVLPPATGYPCIILGGNPLKRRWNHPKPTGLKYKTVETIKGDLYARKVWVGPGEMLGSLVSSPGTTGVMRLLDADGSVRSITAEFVARCMGFPRGMHLPTGPDAYAVLGNAVAPPVAAWALQGLV